MTQVVSFIVLFCVSNELQNWQSSDYNIKFLNKNGEIVEDDCTNVG